MNPKFRAPTRFAVQVLWVMCGSLGCAAQTLEVKPGRTAIVKSEPTADASELGGRLPSGTQVLQIGAAPRYFKIQVPDGRIGWSYKGYFQLVAPTSQPTNSELTAEDLLSRQDVLKIIVIDVEVGDATLILCPEEDGRRDVILIDTGEDDGDRIRDELTRNGIALSGKPIDRFVITHYDRDHCGDAEELLPLAQTLYDHGDNIKSKLKTRYLRLVSEPGVDRRTMTLNYQETFSGGVSIECVAVNRATDFDPQIGPASPAEDNPNSIALIVSYAGFDYFTGGDLTKGPEQSLARGIRNCDVYHVNHHGSSATSSDLSFVQALDPEVSIASNGTRHGHPTATVAKRLLDQQAGNVFFQTNVNDDPRAHHPDPKFVADDTLNDDDELEDAEGPLGTIQVVVDSTRSQYFVLLPGLTIAEGTFPIER